MKYYDNPYQTEKWKAEKWNVVNETQKEKDEIDNEIVYCMSKQSPHLHITLSGLFCRVVFIKV